MLPVKNWSSVLLSTILIPSLVLNLTSLQASANGEVSEENLNTERALRWGGEGLPFDDVLTIRDPSNDRSTW
jgi:hypothetical protein